MPDSTYRFGVGAMSLPLTSPIHMGTTRRLSDRMVDHPPRGGRVSTNFNLSQKLDGVHGFIAPCQLWPTMLRSDDRLSVSQDSH